MEKQDTALFDTSNEFFMFLGTAFSFWQPPSVKIHPIYLNICTSLILKSRVRRSNLAEYKNF